jgi:hypothetical protein
MDSNFQFRDALALPTARLGAFGRKPILTPHHGHASSDGTRGRADSDQYRRESDPKDRAERP